MQASFHAERLNSIALISRDEPALVILSIPERKEIGGTQDDAAFPFWRLEWTARFRLQPTQRNQNRLDLWRR